MNNDDLGIIYLTNKKTKYMTKLYDTFFEECFLLNDDVVLIRTKDKRDSSFKLIDLSIKKKENEEIDEIFINPENTNILFVTQYLGNMLLKIKVRYDDIEKNWDVRLLKDNQEILCDLNTAISYLGKESFIKIINACKNIYNISKEKNQKKL